MIDFVNDIQTFTDAQQLLLVRQAIANLMVVESYTTPTGNTVHYSNLKELQAREATLVEAIAAAAGTGSGMRVLLSRFGNPR